MALMQHMMTTGAWTVLLAMCPADAPADWIARALDQLLARLDEGQDWG